MPFVHRRQDYPAGYWQAVLQMRAAHACAQGPVRPYWYRQFLGRRGATIRAKSAAVPPLKFCMFCVYKNLLHDTTAAGNLPMAAFQGQCHAKIYSLLSGARLPRCGGLCKPNS